jgi:hypothetical protein
MRDHPNPFVMVFMIGGVLSVTLGFFAGRVSWMLLGIFLYLVGSYLAITYSFDLIAEQIADLDRRIADRTVERSE